MAAADKQREVSRVISAYDRACAAPDYADTIVLEAEQIAGDEYRMNWSAEYSGSFIDVSER